jgi:hypothetical protein
MDTIAGAQRQHAEFVVLDLVVVPGDLGLVLPLPMALLFHFLPERHQQASLGRISRCTLRTGGYISSAFNELCSLTIARSSIRAA